MKLGLVIKITNGGEQEVHAINKDEVWAKHTSDVRSLIKELTNFDGTGKSVCFLKFIGQLGYFICVVKARPAGSGRGGDNTAAWIYVPGNVNISGIEGESVIRIVEQAISGEKEIDKVSLANEFSKDYDEKEVLFTPIYEIVSKSDGSVAGRFYGRGTDYTLKEFLGNDIAHPEYKKYRAVFLLDKGLGISMRNNNVLHIPQYKVRRVLPPLCTDFKPYLNSTVVFDKPIEVYAGQPLTITWRRQGFKPVQKSRTISASDDERVLSSLKISPQECIRMIPVNVIQITDTHSNRVDGYELHINGRLVNGEYIEIPDVSYGEDCDLKVTKQGYDPYSDTVNFARKKQNQVVLRPRIYSYRFLIPCYNGKENINDAILTIKSEHQIHKSPVEGYTLMSEKVNEGEDGHNQLEKSIWEPIKHLCCGFLTCIVVLLLYMVDICYEFSFGWPPVKRVKQLTTISDTLSENKSLKDIYSDDKAIAYLKREKTWNRDSLNQYPLLKGLFDDLNKMNLEKLSREWREKLAAKVVYFSGIAYNASMALENDWNVKQGEHNQTYTQNDSLKVEGYIEWLSKDQTSATKPSSENHTSRVSNESERAVKEESDQSAGTERQNTKGNIRRR